MIRFLTLGGRLADTETRTAVLVVTADESFAAAVTPVVHSENALFTRCIEAQDAVKAVLGESPDAIVLDVPTRGLTAEQAIRLLRGLEPRRYVPLIAVCREGDVVSPLDLLRLGADAVLAGLQPELLAAHLHRLLKLREGIKALSTEAANLQTLSVTDALTQLFNHRFFQDRLREEFRRAQRYDDPLALVMLDLDHFKSVNDTWGHPVGDHVLRDVGAILRKSVRETDIVCRYGGEEFCAILPQTHLAGSITVAERIWREISGSRVGPGLRVTASLGVSGFPGRGVTSPDQLLRTADEALYRAKKDGRNRITLHVQSATGAFGGDASKAKAS